MILSDNKRTVCIEMKIWQGTGYSPDFSDDFFDAGLLPHIEIPGADEPAHLVKDVDYCIDQAKSWEQEDENNTVFVDDLVP